MLIPCFRVDNEPTLKHGMSIELVEKVEHNVGLQVGGADDDVLLAFGSLLRVRVAPSRLLHVDHDQLFQLYRQDDEAGEHEYDHGQLRRPDVRIDVAVADCGEGDHNVPDGLEDLELLVAAALDVLDGRRAGEDETRDRGEQDHELLGEGRVGLLNGSMQVAEHVLELTLGEPAVEENGYENVAERRPTRREYERERGERVEQEADLRETLQNVALVGEIGHEERLNVAERGEHELGDPKLGGRFDIDDRVPVDARILAKLLGRAEARSIPTPRTESDQVRMRQLEYVVGRAQRVVQLHAYYVQYACEKFDDEVEYANAKT